MERAVAGENGRHKLNDKDDKYAQAQMLKAFGNDHSLRLRLGCSEGESQFHKPSLDNFVEVAIGNQNYT